MVTFLLTSTTLSAWVFGMGEGNPAYATKWRDRFTSLPDPETAQTAYPEVQSKRFPNGEWIFGVSSDSHSSHWGGTVVLKESTGEIHAYFGHVCGHYRLQKIFNNAKSLQDFYQDEQWKGHFHEYTVSCHRAPQIRPLVSAPKLGRGANVHWYIPIKSFGVPLRS